MSVIRVSLSRSETAAMLLGRTASRSAICVLHTQANLAEYLFFPMTPPTNPAKVPAFSIMGVAQGWVRSKVSADFVQGELHLSGCGEAVSVG